MKLAIAIEELEAALPHLQRAADAFRHLHLLDHHKTLAKTLETVDSVLMSSLAQLKQQIQASDASQTTHPHHPGN